MADSGKRKDAPSGAAGQQRAKKKKTGNAGKWKTPHQQAKALQKEANLQPGDTGIFVTCARHQEAKAAREVGVLFAEYAEKMYDIKSVHDTAGNSNGDDSDEDGEEEDIEKAIQKEVAALTSKPTSSSTNTTEGVNDNSSNRMTPVKMNVDCLLFVRTRPPVDPVAFVRRICEDARRCEEIPGLMRCRYVNRLTPVSVMGKATEAGLVEVAREVLGGVFDLSGKRGGAAAGGGGGAGKKEGEAKGEAEAAKTEGKEGGDAEAGAAKTETETGKDDDGEKKRSFTFAIRPTIRNHSNLKRDVVINTVAGLINDDRHKVKLSYPDKVILIDIYQSVCGMSVVDGDWDALKRFNLTELYSQARNAQTSKD